VSHTATRTTTTRAGPTSPRIRHAVRVTPTPSLCRHRAARRWWAGVTGSGISA